MTRVRGGKAVAEGGDLFGAGDESVDARGRGGLGEAEDLGFGGVVDADGGELELIHAGEDGDSEKLGRVGHGGGGFGSGFEHGGAAGGVDGEEFDAEGGDRADGSGNGVGNVVELEVKEDGEVAAAEFADDGGAFGDVELEADFEPAAETLELVGEGESGQSTGTSRATMRRGSIFYRVQGGGRARHRAQGTGHRAQSTEHRALGTEHRAQSTAQSTGHRGG